MSDSLNKLTKQGQLVKFKGTPLLMPLIFVKNIVLEF